MDTEMQSLNEQARQAIADRQKCEAQLKEIRIALAQSQAEVAGMKHALDDAKSNIKTRFHESATLTKLLKEAEDNAMAMADQRTWLVAVYAALDSQPRWWSLMSKGWKSRRQRDRLRQMKLFDAQKYLELYPDIAADGMDPIRHYILHGMAEGRTCAR